MVGSVVATGKPGLAADLVKEVSAKQNVEVVVIKMAQDIERAQGESALTLIASASGAAVLGRIDVRV